MDKIIIVSSNNNPDYLFFLPYICKAWNSYGWKVACMVTDDVDVNKLEIDSGYNYICVLPKIEGLREATIAQAGRLYAANYLSGDNLLMTSDMDLLPLSDYWHPNENEITVYGHDLTDYSYIPMGYVAMSSKKWKEYMRLTGETDKDMLRDCKETGIAFSQEWSDWWNTDWQILTDRLMPHKDAITFIKRGRRLTGTYAYGRIDRGDSCTIPPNETLIDFHAENNNVRHPDKMNKFIAIFESIYGKLL